MNGLVRDVLLPSLGWWAGFLVSFGLMAVSNMDTIGVLWTASGAINVGTSFIPAGIHLIVRGAVPRWRGSLVDGVLFAVAWSVIVLSLRPPIVLFPIVFVMVCMGVVPLHAMRGRPVVRVDLESGDGVSLTAIAPSVRPPSPIAPSVAPSVASSESSVVPVRAPSPTPSESSAEMSERAPSPTPSEPLDRPGIYLISH